MPEMQFVTSSNIEAVGYDESTQELHVRFLTGRTYVYYDVEEYRFTEMLSGGSVGGYLNQNIKKNYRYAEV
jgi:hypothetical protein